MATVREREIIEAVAKHGSKRGAARALGISASSVRDGVRRAARRDPALHAKGAPEGYHLRGASTLLDASGNVVQQWVKTANDRQDPEQLLAVFREAVSAAPPPRKRRIAAPRDRDGDLLTVYPMGDPHLGMLSWGEETGADFDLAIAEKNLCRAMDQLVTLSPPSGLALIAELGDFFHSDNDQHRTSRSGAALDVDSRWAKILRIGIRAMTRCIDRALEKHAQVRVVCEIGNHDDHTAVMLALCLAEHYRSNPRAQIDTSPSPYHWMEFGKCLLGVTHGHNTKPAALPGIMAHDQREAWGRTWYRRMYCGHVHHERVQEFPGLTVEYFRTLAPRDAWHNASGYRSGRSAVCHVWHKDRGLILRHEIDIEAVESVGSGLRKG